MRNLCSPIGILMLLWLPAVGCRLPGRDGPAPQSLADCRRLSQQGVSALERGDPLKAERLLGQAVTVCPVDAEARRHYAESLWRRGARQEAIAQLDAAGRLAEDDTSVWTRLAEMHLACGEAELARRDADRTLRLDPKSAKAWAIRGGVAKAAGQSGEALTDYLRALSLAPNDRTILLEIAELHRQMNQPDLSLQTLQNLTDTYSPGEEPGQVLFLTGLAYVALGRYDDGVESFSAAVARGSPTPELFYRLGETQLLAGHPMDAADAARRALALEPRHEPSRALLERVEVALRPSETLTK